ncbi:glycosyl hydrolase, BNR repeat-containing protein, partial [mine drainage metagenome]
DDDGARWTDIARGLPAESIHVVREDPHNADVLYVGTDRGVYVSLDRGAHWQSLQANLPTVPVHDLAIQPRDRVLIAGTHGRSVWTLDVLPIEDLTASLMAQPLHLFAVADLKAARDWWQRGSPWFDTRRDAPQLSGSFWARARARPTSPCSMTPACRSSTGARRPCTASTCGGGIC